jgi:hypothetical protein
VARGYNGTSMALHTNPAAPVYLATDQRGSIRTASSPTDSGAFQSQAFQLENGSLAIPGTGSNDTFTLTPVLPARRHHAIPAVGGPQWHRPAGWRAGHGERGDQRDRRH